MKVKFSELPCYVKADTTEGTLAYKVRNYSFDFEKLPTEGLRSEFFSFVMERANVVTVLSLRADLAQYNILCKFLSDKYSGLNSLLEIPLETLVRDLKKWLLLNDKPTATRKVCKRLGVDKLQESEYVRFLKKVYEYLTPEDTRPEREKDIWHVDKLGIKMNRNPVLGTATLNFTKIPQPIIRKEVKDAIFVRMRRLAFGTLQEELVAVNRFCTFLVQEHSIVESLADVDRTIIEDYLLYLNTQAIGKQCYKSELSHLKTMLDLVGRMIDRTEICNLFLPSDIPKKAETLYRCYSDSELTRLCNAIIEHADIQVARAIIIHQKLGTRISETLTLKQDCIVEKDGYTQVRVYQIKTQRTYYKPISNDVCTLIRAAIEYTKERFPNSGYVFAHDKDVNRPMTYAKIQYHLMAIIKENNLRDDSGKLFGVGTHLFRHTYGRKLTEAHFDDFIIAKLMGHTTTSSLKYYRRISNSQLAEETRSFRTQQDKRLKELMKEWK